MVKRRKKGGDPLSWYFPSGHLAETEVAPIQAVKEVLEETGVNVEFESELGTRLHPDTKFFIHYVICRYKAGEPRNLEPHENEAVEWVSASSAPNRITTDLDPRVRDFLIGL
jgi:8-oxo-dGTP diphosphatase